MHSEMAEQIDSSKFISTETREKEIDYLVRENVLNINEARMIFGKGYAAMRNVVLYYAIKSNYDYLIFMDDDEYPMAVTNTRNTVLWGGQHVLQNHLKFISQADITYGYHCGYVSPIPFVKFNDVMTEKGFSDY